MSQYSIVATAPHTIVLSDHGVILGEGVNAFSITTDTIEEVRHRLVHEGACISSVFKIEQEPTVLRDILLEGEDPLQAVDLHDLGSTIS